MKNDYYGMTIDIHGMIETEAIVYLNSALDGLGKAATEITIIHGYHNGHVLQDLVRKKYHHRRIARKIMTMNPGETILVIKQKT